MRPHSKQYSIYISSFDWYLKTLRVFERAGKKCERCGQRNLLEVHHKTYAHLGAEPLEDLALLCPTCHAQADEERKYDQASAVYWRRVEGWAKKVYGEYWNRNYDFRSIAEDFDNWLASRSGQ